MLKWQNWQIRLLMFYNVSYAFCLNSQSDLIISFVGASEEHIEQARHQSLTENYDFTMDKRRKVVKEKKKKSETLTLGSTR
jgi:hypothetical protein